MYDCHTDRNIFSKNIRLSNLWPFWFFDSLPLKKATQTYFCDDKNPAPKSIYFCNRNPPEFLFLPPEKKKKILKKNNKKWGRRWKILLRYQQWISTPIYNQLWFFSQHFFQIFLSIVLWFMRKITVDPKACIFLRKESENFSVNINKCLQKTQLLSVYFIVFFDNKVQNSIQNNGHFSYQDSSLNSTVIQTWYNGQSWGQSAKS